MRESIERLSQFSGLHILLVVFIVLVPGIHPKIACLIMKKFSLKQNLYGVVKYSIRTLFFNTTQTELFTTNSSIFTTNVTPLSLIFK